MTNVTPTYDYTLLHKNIIRLDFRYRMKLKNAEKHVKRSVSDRSVVNVSRTLRFASVPRRSGLAARPGFYLQPVWQRWLVRTDFIFPFFELSDLVFVRLCQETTPAVVQRSGSVGGVLFLHSDAKMISRALCVFCLCQIQGYLK